MLRPVGACRICLRRQGLSITAAGIISKRWWRSDAVTSPGALAAKLSRRARHHGAIFAVPAKDKFIPEETELSRAGGTNLERGEKVNCPGVTISL